MAVEFEQITPPNDTTIYRSISGTLDGVTFTGVTSPTNPFTLMVDFIKQSDFIVEMALHTEYYDAGDAVTKIEIPFPSNMYELLPALADGLPPVAVENDLTPPYMAWFYYSDTEFVEGTVQLGLRYNAELETLVPMFILTPKTPVNLVKFNCNVKWLKTINLILYP